MRERGTGTTAYQPARGRWIGTIKRDGRRYYCYFEGAEDRAGERGIAAELKKLGRQIEEGLADQSAERFDTFLDFYLKEIAPSTMRAKSLETAQYYVAKRIKPLLGHYRLGELEAIHIQRAVNVWKAEVAPATVKKLHGIVRAALNRAIRLRKIKENPARYVDLPPMHGKTVRPIEPEEIAGQRRAIAGDWVEPIIIFTSYTGMRQGEVLGLRWSHVHMDAPDYAYVDIEYTLSRAFGSWSLQAPKTEESGRRLGLAPTAVEWLRKQQAIQEGQEKAAGDRWQHHDLVFSDPLGQPLIGRTVTERYKRLLRDAGVRVSHFHALRHAAASVLLSDPEVTITDVQHFLGHSSVVLTSKTYGHLLNGERKKVASAIERAWSQKE